MELIEGIFIGIVFCLCSLVIWFGAPDKKPAAKRVQTHRADELPKLDKTVDLQKYQDKECIHCPHFDGYDMCLRREHWGTVIQNTVEYCKKRRYGEVQKESRS